MHDSFHCDIHFIAMVWNPTRSEVCLYSHRQRRGYASTEEGALDGGMVDARIKKNSPFL